MFELPEIYVLAEQINLAFVGKTIKSATANAVAHRDYSIAASKIRIHMFSDRLEIFSPGTIPNTMTIDSLPLRAVTRNELLSSFLSRCPIEQDILNTERHYFMERRGEGVPIILIESKNLSGCLPVYRLLDEAELMLTIYAANVNYS